MILVFGGAGQLGTQLVENAASRGIALTALGRSEVDITDADAVRRAIDSIRPSVVVNAAAYNQVDKAESEPEAAHRGNAVGPGILASASAGAGKPFIHVSTDYVFDGRKAQPYTEQDAVGPLNTYGRSKEAGEQAVRAANPQHLILRTAWVYGVHANNLLKTMLCFADERQELSFVDDHVSSPTASSDLADAILVAAERMMEDDDVPWGTYHVAGGGQASRFDLARVVLDERTRFVGSSPALKAVPASTFPAPAQRPVFSALESSAFANAFGFTMPAWEESARRAVADYFERKGAA